MATKHLTPRMFLARELQRARGIKGIKADDVAKSIFASEGLIRSWEKGRRIPQPDHLAAVEELYGPEAVAGIYSRIREELINTSEPLEWMRAWREVETRATSLLSFQTTVIPGLLQTEDYATAVFREAKHLGDVGEMVKARLERQRILDGEDDEPPTLVALIFEPALLGNVGGAKVMYDQLKHLTEMAERDNIIVQVIPLMSRVCAGFLAAFVVATFNGGEVAYIDNQLNGEVVEEPENVAILRRLFERFRAEALSEPESLDLIRKVMEERWATE